MIKESLLTNLQKLQYLVKSFWTTSTQSLSFIPTYYNRNELVWSDGFLLDFLQKKTADLWIRKFVIYTGFLFSERLVFEAVVRVYLDNVIWPSHNLSTFDTANVSEMLLNIIYLYFSLFIISFTMYIFFLI